jgi:hypothetical protein
MTISLKSISSGTVITCDDAMALARRSKMFRFWSIFYRAKAELEIIIYKLFH